MGVLSHGVLGITSTVVGVMKGLNQEIQKAEDKMVKIWEEKPYKR